MFLEWENNSGKLKIISEKFQGSGKFQNNATNDIKQISLGRVIKKTNKTSSLFKDSFWVEIKTSIGFTVTNYVHKI